MMTSSGGCLTRAHATVHHYRRNCRGSFVQLSSLILVARAVNIGQWMTIASSICESSHCMDTMRLLEFVCT
eukprot:824685-Amphidinium_carterae.1